MLDWTQTSERTWERSIYSKDLGCTTTLRATRNGDGYDWELWFREHLTSARVCCRVSQPRATLAEAQEDAETWIRAFGKALVGDHA